MQVFRTSADGRRCKVKKITYGVDDDNSRHAIFPAALKRDRQEGAVRGGCDEEDHKEEEEEEEEDWSQKKEQLTVIIVMFNQTPAIKLINTLFPV